MQCAIRARPTRGAIPRDSSEFADRSRARRTALDGLAGAIRARTGEFDSPACTECSAEGDARANWDVRERRLAGAAVIAMRRSTVRVGDLREGATLVADDFMKTEREPATQSTNRPPSSLAPPRRPARQARLTHGRRDRLPGPRVALENPNETHSPHPRETSPHGCPKAAWRNSGERARSPRGRASAPAP